MSFESPSFIASRVLSRTVLVVECFPRVFSRTTRKVSSHVQLSRRISSIRLHSVRDFNVPRNRFATKLPSRGRMRSTQPDPPPDQGRPSSCRAARSGMALCPICGRAFGVNQIMEHADKCASRSEPASAPAQPKQRKQPSAKAAPSPLAQSSSRRTGDGTKRGSSHKFSSQAPTPREGLKVFDMVRAHVLHGWWLA